MKHLPFYTLLLLGCSNCVVIQSLDRRHAIIGWDAFYTVEELMPLVNEPTVLVPEAPIDYLEAFNQMHWHGWLTNNSEYAYNVLIALQSKVTDAQYDHFIARLVSRLLTILPLKFLHSSQQAQHRYMVAFSSLKQLGATLDANVMFYDLCLRDTSVSPKATSSATFTIPEPDASHSIHRAPPTLRAVLLEMLRDEEANDILWQHSSKKKNNAEDTSIVLFFNEVFRLFDRTAAMHK